MPTIIEKLENYDREGHEALAHMCVARYLKGYCYAFAIAVHRLTGWPMVALWGNPKLVGAGAEKAARHAALLILDQDAFFDARGVVSAEELGKPFGDSPPYSDITEKELR